MTPKYIINIGLAVADQSASLSEAEVLTSLAAAGLQLLGEHRIVTSDTEPTLVAEVRVPHDTCVDTLFYGLARRLQQDAIAAFDTATHEGALYGPRAAEWGPFNPAYFFLLSGHRMSEDMPQDGYCYLRSRLSPDLPAGSIGRVLEHSGHVASVDFGDGPVIVAAGEICPLEYSVMEA